VKPTAARAGPLAIDRYLLPSEVHVVRLRQHPAFLIPPLAGTLGALLAAIAISAIREGNKSPQIIVWILTLFLLIRFVFTAAAWFVQYIVITEERLLLISGLKTRTVKMIPLPKLKEMTFERSLAGRIMKFGSFIIESGGQIQLTLGYIVYSEQLYLEICSTIFPQLAYNEDTERIDESPPVSGES